MRAPDEASGVSRAEQDAQAPGVPADGRGMPEGAGGEPGPPLGRRRDIDARLGAVRARLKELRQRGVDAGRSWAASLSEREEAAQRHAAEAHAAAARVLASSAEAFRHATEAHDRAASMHHRTAAAGIGDVRGHERQAALHRAAAAADRQRAERAQSLLSESERAGPTAVSDEPREGIAR
jgi:hypothetical protein